MDVNIRRATPDDYEALYLLFEALAGMHQEYLPERFQPPAGPAVLRDILLTRLADPNMAFWVAEDQAVMIGFLHAEIMKTPDIPTFVPRRYVYVNDVFVRPEYRGQRLGQHLMAAAEEWATSIGAASIEIGVYEFNAGATRFYEHLGYETLYRRLSKPLSAAPRGDQ